MKASETAQSQSPWTPLRQPVFRALWLAAMASNIGTWVHEVGAAWTMTSLTTSTTLIALVQASATLPMFAFALPAGVLADLVDRRRVLLFGQCWMTLAAGGLAVTTALDAVTPGLLLFFTAALGCGLAFSAPAWQSIVPELVDRSELAKAVALNSMGFNAARALGPALGGALLALFGAAANFALNTVSFLGVLFVLARWQREPEDSGGLPGESFSGAFRAGARYVRYSPRFQTVMVRGGLFVFAASAWWALLPSMVRFQLGAGPGGYGLVVGAFGAGAVAAAWLLPPIREKLTADALALVASVIFAISLVALAAAPKLWLASIAAGFAGGAWLTVLSGFNVAAQSSLPGWVRGRALSAYMLVFFGGLAFGASFWGAVADLIGPRLALVGSAALVLLGLLSAVRFRLGKVDPSRLAPSRHWPAPLLVVDPEPHGRRVLVTVEYLIDPSRAEEFDHAMQKVKRSRHRAGSVRWGLWEDAAEPGRYMESFVDESWVEHLRHHQRLTEQDLAIEEAVKAFHIASDPPRVRHLLSHDRLRRWTRKP
ncbi:MAG: MFS transporter [Deltaproteobacteria bacterium]|nr:MFS transporter [Deltaproteobacteria bacterium]